MFARAVRRLPGVQFESRAPPLADVLPRMDVAVFVGFAASGPLHTPVALEDPRVFADLFGDDAPLAWDRERSGLQRANLGPAVRAFFRNGGSRCWVVRVARAVPLPAEPDDWARSNRFPVAGLARLSRGALLPAFVSARSEGSWSDRLGVAAALQLRPLLARHQVEGGRVVSVQLDAPDTVVAGDVLRLTWSTGSPSSPAASLLAPIAAIEGNLATLGDEQVWQQLAPPATLPLSRWTASWFPHGESPEPLPPLDGEPAWGNDGTVTVVLATEAPEMPGAFLLLSRGGEQVWVMIDDVRGIERPSSPPARFTALTGRWSRPTFTTPPGLLADASAKVAGERVRAELWVRGGGGPPLRLGELGLAPGHPRFFGALPTDRRLFEPDEDTLSADERALRDRVRALAGDGVDLRSHHAELWQSVANPRFPLAVDGGRTDLFLPIGMPTVVESFLDAVPVPGDDAERDGLANFAADLFLDRDLADQTATELGAQADFLRWQQPSPRRLNGIHAAWAVEEATLISAPDAVQRGWSREQVVAPGELDAPQLTAAADAEGRWNLTWTSVDPDARYALERASRSDFAAPQPVALASPADTAWLVPASVPDGTWFRVRAYRQASSASDYFQIGDREVAGSFWSDPVAVIVPPPQFVDCPPGALGVPVAALAAAPDVNGSYRLSWSAVAFALAYEVQESSALDFGDAAPVFVGDATEASLYGRAPGRYHYRVRARGSLATVSAPLFLGGDGLRFEVTGTSTPAHLLAARYAGAVGEEVVFDGAAFTERFAGTGNSRAAVTNGFRYLVARDGGWPGAPSFHAWDPAAVGGFGNGVAVTVPSPSRRVLNPVAAYAAGSKREMLEIQRALLRLCAARGDLLVVLSLPEHYRESEAARHPAELRSLTPEVTPWSYGALYHPWVLVEGDHGLLRSPPEGAICGVMARRAVHRGAWIAPANEPLGDVLGLTPAIPREQWGRLLDAQVNLVRQEPHGFVVLSADTLAQDPELVQVNVRRLLVLLRRAALRLGPTFVFEPNNDIFRRSVERAFGALLDGLRLRGAFAGAAADDSFQVAVDTSLNDETALDQGRFTVELKVAPSLPLAFLTVRLVQSGSRGQVTEGR